LTRVSERIRRASACDEPSGARTSRCRRCGVLLHGTVRTGRSPVSFSESDPRWPARSRSQSVSPRSAGREW
jgi:hypothetical protein